MWGYYSQELVQTDLTPLYYGLYDALSRIIWSISLSYIIFACVHDPTGLVNRFLSHRFWLPASRLTYAVFCCHFALILLIMGTMKAPLHFSILNYTYISVAVLVSMILVGILATLAFEVPFINLKNAISDQKSTILKNLKTKIDFNANGNCCKSKNE